MLLPLCLFHWLTILWGGVVVFFFSLTKTRNVDSSLVSVSLREPRVAFYIGSCRSLAAIACLSCTTMFGIENSITFITDS